MASNQFAGIVLSQAAVLALLLALDPDCNGTDERTSFDETIARFLMGTNVTRLDTRDQNGSARFLARPVENLLMQKNVSPYDGFVKESLHPPQLVSENFQSLNNGLPDMNFR